ncbi:MAG: KOW domain-containing RNA-binding protein [Blautia sp.]|nr:KOW domain-containing RNA-binding protein [Blautia sp.]MCM1200085.1 KOW domain-containing RNA-binding protein [Bacteroides fragilis]
MEMTGMLASSKAGHDKNTVYVIIKEETEYVYLADGGIRTLEKPKRKNKKHIQVIKKCPEPGFSDRVKAGLAEDAEIRRVLKQYGMSIIKQKQEVADVES